MTTPNLAVPLVTSLDDDSCSIHLGLQVAGCSLTIIEYFHTADLVAMIGDGTVDWKLFPSVTGMELSEHGPGYLLITGYIETASSSHLEEEASYHYSVMVETEAMEEQLRGLTLAE